MADGGGARAYEPGRPGLEALTDAQFAMFQELILREAGIRLTSAKRELFINRLARRVRDLGLTSFGAYYRRVRDDDDERVRMLDRITTNETQFFREPRHFDLLERVVFPEWLAQAERHERPRSARVWSCACSTGEEPYSIAMSTLAHLPGWDVPILATDLSTAVLAKARAAVWPIDRASQIPEPFLKAFMLKGTRSQEGKMKAGEALRARVELRRFNLNEPTYPFGAFDLVFCRNVLIYFDGDARRRVLERLADALAPGGYLFLGHAETASGMGEHLRPVMPTVYTKA